LGDIGKQNINGMKLDNINKVKHFTIRSDVSANFIPQYIMKTRRTPSFQQMVFHSAVEETGLAD
jgi:hypothetical protein